MTPEHTKRKVGRPRKLADSRTEFYNNLRQIYGACVLCGSTKRLDVHHCDGLGPTRADTPNDHLSNLRVVCRSCHGQLHRKTEGRLETQKREDPQRTERRSTLDTRRQAMIEQRLAGATLKAIGERYGITRERVRQLTKGFKPQKADIVDNSPFAHLTKAERQERFKQEEIIWRTNVISALRKKQGEQSLYRFAKDLGMKYPTLHRVINGKHGAGMASICKIAARFPDLAPVLLGQDEEAAA